MISFKHYPLLNEVQWVVAVVEELGWVLAAFTIL